MTVQREVMSHFSKNYSLHSCLLGPLSCISPSLLSGRKDISERNMDAINRSLHLNSLTCIFSSRPSASNRSEGEEQEKMPRMKGRGNTHLETFVVLSFVVLWWYGVKQTKRLQRPITSDIDFCNGWPRLCLCSCLLSALSSLLDPSSWNKVSSEVLLIPLLNLHCLPRNCNSSKKCCSVSSAPVPTT